MKAALVLILALAACGRGASRQRVEFANLTFELPGNWVHQDTSRRGLATTVWTPDDNADRKESISVIRTELAPAVAQAGVPAIDRLLESAQVSLPDARMLGRSQVKTASGLTGTRIDISFVPPGLHERYRRVHVVLVDGASLVHVLYTARSPEDDLSTFNLVLGSIREQGEG